MRFVNALAFALAVSMTSGCAYFWQQPGTPLATAAHRGDLTAIRALIASGADLNQFDPTGQTPLHWAARGGHRSGPHKCGGEANGREAVVTTLIDAGADLNLTDRRNAIPGGSSGWTPLHVALHHEQFVIARRMLARGANPNIRSHQGETLMALAAEEGAPVELLKELLAHGFDPARAH
ncbi:MAG TPA: ankyrin repeat domain-containing protein [Vicinamibacterales bacterium]|nr:ankyrin repeat domain-containing protein [Vicinamibacterales bacterium]